MVLTLCLLIIRGIVRLGVTAENIKPGIHSGWRGRGRVAGEGRVGSAPQVLGGGGEGALSQCTYLANLLGVQALIEVSQHPPEPTLFFFNLDEE